MTKLLPAALLFMALVLVAGGLKPQRAEASISGLGLDQACLANGSVALTFNWTGNDPTSIQQWIDLSINDNGWAPNTFINMGPLPGYATSAVWNGIVPSMRHYVRINEQRSNGIWSPSMTYFFDSMACTPPRGGGAPINPKLTSHLNQLVTFYNNGTLAATPALQSAQVGLSGSGAGSLSFTPEGRVIMDVRVLDTSAAAVNELAGHGAVIISVSPDFSGITISADISRLTEIAGIANVQSMMEVIRPK